MVCFPLALLVRLVVAMRFRYDLIACVLLHPLAVLLLLGVCLNSLVWHYTGRTRWKGRPV